MSEPFTVQERKQYFVTLDAKNATRPTHRIDVSICNIFVGPKRTVRRGIDDYFSQPVYFVPPPETWTLDTVRMLFHELASFLPEDEYGAVEVFVRRRHVGRGRPREQFDLVARGRVSETQTTEVTADVSGEELSEPMRDTLIGLVPETAPVPITALRDPAYIGGDEWKKRHGDSATSDDAQRIKVILGRLKSLCYLRPPFIPVLETFINSADPNGDTKDE